jgi:hypothetical protein
MEKLKVTLSEELSDKVRKASLVKYGNMRSSSKLVEMLVQEGIEKMEEPANACSVLGFRTPASMLEEEEFKTVVDAITVQLREVRGRMQSEYTDFMVGSGKYFAYKDACELFLNELNRTECWSCAGISSCLIPMYPTAGKNFVEWAKVDKACR